MYTYKLKFCVWCLLRCTVVEVLVTGYIVHRSSTKKVKSLYCVSMTYLKVNVRCLFKLDTLKNSTSQKTLHRKRYLKRHYLQRHRKRHGTQKFIYRSYFFLSIEKHSYPLAHMNDLNHANDN